MGDRDGRCSRPRPGAPRAHPARRRRRHPRRRVAGAAPAHAGSYQCNLRYYYNYDGSPAWPSSQVNDPSQHEYASCSDAPAIARYDGGTIIAAHYQTIVGYVATCVNPDGAPNWTLSDTYGGAFVAVGPPAVIPYSGGTELTVPVYNRLGYFWKPVGSTLQGPEFPASSG